MKSDTGPLYGILDTGYVEKQDLLRVAEALLAGGVAILQLRAKGHDSAAVLSMFQDTLTDLPRMCREAGVPLIINDFPEVALAIGADGVHIGQDDGSLSQVRATVGDGMIVGRSTHSLQQAKDALAEGFDYIGFGPLFPTPTKQGRPGIGLENIAEVEKNVGSHIPVFCIGGIKPDNLELVLASGARRVVIVSALLQAQDIENATRSVLKTLTTDL
ncbi:thiamine phosphate synthase [Oceaniferula spumae]